ncbi:iron complex transport system ATP-binding protein [Lachnospiraceae bacterium]|nr:iron complex transport system ATP-binding protein [Lachnospiraceae bacterium]
MGDTIKISVKDLKYSVGAHKILNGVTLDVPKGKMIGVIGPNGSGKTTTLKHIYRAIDPKDGVVYLNGKDVHSYSYRDSAREMTVMKQEHNTDFSYSIYEMVMMGRIPYRKMFEADTKEDRDIVVRSLKYVGMDKMLERPYSELSGGEKQRVMIARSIAQETEIFILDEPTNHLDVHYQWAIMDLIRKIGKTVISVFHELNLASNYCDEIYVVDNGCIVAHGTPEKIITKRMLSEVFKIDADIIKTDNGATHILYNKAIV